MQFNIGPYRYTLIIANRRLYDEQGDELLGRAIETPHVVVIGRTVPPGRRLEILRHEIQHCWYFFVPRPTTEEEECNLNAFIARQFMDDLDAQGGENALKELPLEECPELGRPRRSNTANAIEPFGRPDRKVCSACGCDVMCGSIQNGEPELHGPSGRYWIERHMSCDACNTLTVWREVASSDGVPTGELIQVPVPRMLRGVEASHWLASNAAMLETA